MTRIYTSTNPHRVRNVILTLLAILLLLILCPISIAIQAFGSTIRLQSPIAINRVGTPVVLPVAVAPTPVPTTRNTQVLPTPISVSIPVSAPPQGVAEQNGSTVRLFIVNPEAPDQTQVRHPGVYVQTNVSNTAIRFVLDIPNGYVGIVGGFTIDGTSNGVYQALPPGTHQRTITDGFALIVRQVWAQEEWEFRLNEARTYGWAMQNINSGPLQSGTSTSPSSSPTRIPSSTTQAPSVTTNQRQASGINGSLRFPAGASVCGNRLVLDSGRSFTDACFRSAPSAGTVTNGVIYPWETEFKAANIDPR